MTEMLESVMLICFGCSWPVSVVRNIRAKSAKNMSLGFILLIIAGYVAGICAKLYAHSYGYVLIVYVLNLIFVLTNLVVYFINSSYDRKKESKNKSKKESAAFIKGGAN